MGNRAEVLRGIDWVKVGGKFRKIGCRVDYFKAPTQHLAVGQAVRGDVSGINFIATDEVGSYAIVEHGDCGQLCIIHDAGNDAHHRNWVSGLYNSNGNGERLAGCRACWARDQGVLWESAVENGAASAGSIGSIRRRNGKISRTAEAEIIDADNFGEDQEIRAVGRTITTLNG